MFHTIHRNDAEGMESRILVNDRGFTVFLHDTDADETLDCSTTYPTLEWADREARELVGLPVISVRGRAPDDEYATSLQDDEFWGCFSGPVDRDELPF